MINNYHNYYIYQDFVKQGHITIHTDTINVSNWRSHYVGLFNILKDGIEVKELHRQFITVIFDSTNEDIDLTIDDFLFNLMMWYPIIALNHRIEPWHLVFKKNIQSRDIKKFIDRFFIKENIKTTDTKILNNIIATTLYPFLNLDEFAYFFANTLNLEDDINLMEVCPEFDSLIHCDLSGVPIEQVKDKGQEITNRAIELILDSKNIMGYEHCLKNPFAAGEGINKKQYRENHYNIGTKPDGHGSIFHEIINQSYITGGLNTFTNQFIDCATARVAQIISKKNVGESGGFSRILGLNNINTFLHSDPNYSCLTKNLIPITMHNGEFLSRLKNRTFRFHPDGIEFELDPDDASVIGKKIYMRSPITCASYAAGKGICYACYGRRLANINHNINIGRIATEIVTEQYTQMRLSAKHLLETLIQIITWNDNFYKFLDIDINILRLDPSLLLSEEEQEVKDPLKGWALRLKEDNIMSENDDDFYKHLFYSDDTRAENDSITYNEYVNEFTIIGPNGEEYPIHSVTDEDTSAVKMFISKDLNNLIRSLLSNHREEYLDGDEINIPLVMLQDKDLFTLKIQNNDLGKALDVFTDLINKKDVTKSFSIPELVEKLLFSTINGSIVSDSIHLEVILANQIRSIADRLEMPNWTNVNEQYEVLTLNEALTDNPSPIISLLYQKLARALYYPLTFKKNKPSIFDPFFMRKPKKFLNVDHEVHDMNGRRIKPGQSPVIFHHNPTGDRPRDLKKFLEPFRTLPKTELDD